MQMQGEKKVSSHLFQDNKSAIRIEENGQMSMGRNSKHIEIRYFFVKDRTTGNNIKIRHCPTEKMISDFLTKPLQGSLFREFRAVLMGHVELSEEYLHFETCKERVEKEKETVKDMKYRTYADAVEGEVGKDPNGLMKNNSSE
jgi:hypothetical protein